VGYQSPLRSNNMDSTGEIVFPDPACRHKGRLNFFHTWLAPVPTTRAINVPSHKRSSEMTASTNAKFFQLSRHVVDTK